ncbi:MAG: hypothetical protein M3155_02195 [Actinomycetota bacterium]|nr:hypothetical protein [Actinomycetota bacterium]
MHVQDWQIDCCGDRFAVGDEVEWTLMLAPEDSSWDWPPEIAVELEPTEQREARHELGEWGRIVTVAGTEVAVPDYGDASQQRLRGILIEDHHGTVPDDLVATCGVVRRIRVVRQEFHSTGHQAGCQISGTVALRDVDRVPDAFLDRRPADGPHLVEVGVLADLELRARPSAL